MMRSGSGCIVNGQKARSMGKLISRASIRSALSKRHPPLQNGDRLSRDEFERRYDAMPELKKAELIDGVVHLPSPVKHRQHGRPHARLMGWLFTYHTRTPGTDLGCDSSVRLGRRNEPQPDACLFILPDHSGTARISADDFLEGSPEFVAEVAASSASYDLHSKLAVYLRNGVREYLVWRVFDRKVDWFARKRGRYQPIPAGRTGILKSLVFPGLWLDPAAMVQGDKAK